MGGAAWILSLLAFAGCKGLDDASLLVGSTYACLFDSTLECQIIDYDGEEGRWGEEKAPSGRFTEVVSSSYYLCGILEDGEPVCWGWNESGQTDIPAGLSISSFELGYVNTCALDDEGYLTCWGNEWTGLNEAPPGPFDKIAVAERLGCGWSEESGWTCWGSWWGVDVAESGERFEWDIPEEPPVSLVGTNLNICMTDELGRISCWGYADFGVNAAPSGEGWHSLSGGLAHACAFDANDQVVCWGNDADTSWRQFPEGDWTAFTAGSRADCGIHEDGEIDCWGCIRVDPFTCDWDD